MEIDTPALLVDLDRHGPQHRAVAAACRRCGVPLPRAREDAQGARDRAPTARRRGAAGSSAPRSPRPRSSSRPAATDVVVAYPVFGGEKWRRLAALAERARIGVNVDSDGGDLEAIAGRSRGGRRDGRRLSRRRHRYASRRCRSRRAWRSLSQLCAVVERLGGVELAGVTTHSAVGESATAERLEAGETRERDSSRWPRSCAGTGTRFGKSPPGAPISGRGVAAAPGVTELRAGTYVFNDLTQRRSGLRPVGRPRADGALHGRQHPPAGRRHRRRRAQDLHQRARAARRFRAGARPRDRARPSRARSTAWRSSRPGEHRDARREDPVRADARLHGRQPRRRAGRRSAATTSRRCGRSSPAASGA